MKKATYTITKNQNLYQLEMHDSNGLLLLTSKCFHSFYTCEKFLSTLRVHLCFQTNFNRSKNLENKFGFELRTCWDDLIASSIWFNSREERENAMHQCFDANKEAAFVYTPMHDATHTTWQEVA